MRGVFVNHYRHPDRSRGSTPYIGGYTLACRFQTSEYFVTNMPTFTILLPAKGRPELVVDAITSIIGQTFGDFEVIFSNNGADPLVREAIRPFLHDPRVRYFE